MCSDSEPTLLYDSFIYDVKLLLMFHPVEKCLCFYVIVDPVLN